MPSSRKHLPTLTGTIKTRTGRHVQFQFVASGKALPFVVLSNHSVGSEGDIQSGGCRLRYKMLIQPAGKDNRWQRTDVAEPVVDYVESRQAVPDSVRTEIHDDLLDGWEAYMDQRPELLVYARLTEVNNQIVQLEEKLQLLHGQASVLEGKRSNLVDLEKRLQSQIRPTTDSLPAESMDILNSMVTDNCWLTLDGESKAELYPYNCPESVGPVDFKSAVNLVVGGYVQLHRHLADGRTVFKSAERGRNSVTGGGS